MAISTKMFTYYDDFRSFYIDASEFFGNGGSIYYTPKPSFDMISEKTGRTVRFVELGPPTKYARVFIVDPKENDPSIKDIQAAILND